LKRTKFSNQRIETLVNQATKFKDQIVTSDVAATAGDMACWTTVTGCPKRREIERDSRQEKRGRREIERDRAGRRGDPHWPSDRASVISATVAGDRPSPEGRRVDQIAAWLK